MNTTSNESAFQKLLAFLDRLDETKTWYRMHRIRDAVMIDVATPGVRWEVEFFEDGHVEVERFVSESDGLLDESPLEEIFAGDNGGDFAVNPPRIRGQAPFRSPLPLGEG